MTPKYCPKCQSRASCVDSRSSGDATRRRYKCRSCAHSYSSVEFIAELARGGAAGNASEALREGMEMAKQVRDIMKEPQ